ncbi:MAG: UbiD family decarboxylase [Nitriliruptorales bacterium]|nr:UbiD family decarboxylase [Nitriliruptorales bacterium]
MAKDLRSFLNEVVEHRPGDVKIVDSAVDPRFGITAWGAAYERRGEFPAFLFTNVEGGATSVVTNLAATWERMALALGTSVHELQTTTNMNEGRTAHPPVEVAREQAPVKEVVWTGDEARLDRLPIPTHNHADGGPYLTAAVGIMRDPLTEELNAGIYRHHVYDARSMGVWFFGSHHGGTIHRRYEQKMEGTPIGLAIGHHPGFLMGAVSRVPGIGGEYNAAGAFLGESVEVVRAEKLDILVPARAEIVIEGVIRPGEQREEGPFAEWPGLYVAGGPKPIIDVVAITMRRDAVFQDIQSAGQEHRLMGGLPRIASVQANVSKVVDELVGVNIPLHTRMHCYVSIKKTNDGEPTRAAFAALNTEPENLRMIVVVDDDIDVHDEKAVSWAVGTRFDAERDLQIIPRWNGPAGLLPTNWSYDDKGARQPRMSSACIIDATKPAPPIQYPDRAYVPQAAIEEVRPESTSDFTPGWELPAVR